MCVCVCGMDHSRYDFDDYPHDQASNDTICNVVCEWHADHGGVGRHGLRHLRPLCTHTHTHTTNSLAAHCRAHVLESMVVRYGLCNSLARERGP